MYTEAVTHYSQSLGRDMHMMIYGHDGLPFLAFPTQDSMCRNYEDFGMIDQLSDYLESGKIRIFVVDTVDRRSARQEQYFHYITDEAVPFILSRTGGWLPMTTGLSMGANHALNMFLRRPDLFSGVIALSGVYDTDVFFNGYMDSTLYMNSPERYRVPGKRTGSGP